MSESDPIFDPGDYEVDSHVVQLLEKILKELKELNKTYKMVNGVPEVE